jgi:AraC-like DNA-binding protein
MIPHPVFPRQCLVSQFHISHHKITIDSTGRSVEGCPVYYEGHRLRWADRRVHTPNAVCGKVMYEPGGVCGPRVQRDFELVMLHSGECEVSLDETVHAMAPGAIYLLLPGRRGHFRFSADKETQHSYCSIRPGFMPRRLQKSLCRAPFSVPCSEVFHLILTAVFKLRARRHRATSTLIDQLSLSLFAEFLHAALPPDDEAGRDPAVRAFLHHVEGQFGDGNCLHEAHKAAGISRNALIYKFRNELHTTPARHLWRVRVERGAAMLGETGYTTAEIAYRCGFTNPFHFSRRIKQHFGQSPKDLRRQAWSAEAQR